MSRNSSLVPVELVNVILPIYRSSLSPEERCSLRQGYRILQAYPLTVIHPHSLDLSALAEEFPRLRFEPFDDVFFQGIAGYNRLMLSSAFYGRFLDYRYLLIYQLDAYVFRDELRDWCEKGYDYIGAPWLRRPVYRLPFVAAYMRIVRRYHRWRGVPDKQSLYNRVGNGGFSLRKVESHYRVTCGQTDRIRLYLAHRHHLYNEDVFWATEPDGFRYPAPEEALRFAFDKYPQFCYRLTDGHLPFGCHAWYKRKMRAFWQPIIRF